MGAVQKGIGHAHKKEKKKNDTSLCTLNQVTLNQEIYSHTSQVQDCTKVKRARVTQVGEEGQMGPQLGSEGSLQEQVERNIPELPPAKAQR